MSSARVLMSAASAGHGVGAARASGFASLEALERRALLTTYTYTPAIDAFHLESLVRPVEAPGGGGGAPSFGAVVAELGDLDHDGAADFAVAAPGALNSDGRYAGDSGAVFLYSGRTLELIRTLSDGAPGFGAAMVSIGDINHDGVNDLAIGSPSADTNADATLDFFGRVGVYSGADGSVLWSRSGDSRLDELGWALARAGDVNHDAITDLIVGAPGAGGDALNPGPGKAFVLSGADGSVITSFTGEANGDRFGYAVDGGVDIPGPTAQQYDAGIGDGAIDFLIGAPARNANAGAAYAINGSDGSVRYRIDGEAGDEAGTAVAFLGTTTGPNLTGSLRMAIGSPGHDNNHGVVRAITAGNVNNESIDGENEAGSRFGARVYAIDLPLAGDSNSYFVVTAPTSPSGHNLFLQFPSTSSEFAVQSELVRNAAWLAAIGDADADGITDLAAGFPSADAQAGRGTVSIFPYPVASDFFAPDVVAASDNAMNFVLGVLPNIGTTPFQGADFQGYIVSNGQLFPATRFPGLPPDAILEGVNNSGLFFGHRGPPLPSQFRSLDSIFLLRDGVLTTLTDATTSYVGAHPTGLLLTKVGNNGDVIFSGFTAGADGVSSDGVPRAYLWRSGVLTELWHGQALDITSDGVILGHNEQGASIVRSVDGTVTVIPNFQAQLIRDDGTVIGTVNQGTLTPRLALWQAGQITILSETINPPPEATLASWAIYSADTAGRILARFEWIIPSSGPPPSVNPHTNYLYTPENGFQVLAEIVNDHHEFQLQLTHNRLLDSGAIVADGFILLPVPDSGLPDIHNTPPTSAAPGPTGLFLTTLDQNGNAILLRRDGIRFGAETLPYDHSIFGEVESAVTYVDTRDHRTYAVVRTSANHILWFRQRADSTFSDGINLDFIGPGRGAITGPLSTFTSLDGRVHITGVSEFGDILIYFQNNNQFPPDSFQNWGFDDISLHTNSTGQPRPRFTGHTELVGYITPWGGMNIAGINTEHEIEVMWWAPGVGPFWQHDNLSVSAGTPALAADARPTAFVAPWGGMHLGAIDAAGHLQSTWWAPGLAHWEHNDLTAEFDGPLLAPDSLTAYVTDWGGLNVAGLDVVTGAAKVYWWTPTTGGWITEALNLGPDAPTFSGRLESAARGNNLNIFAAASGGDLLRLYWYPSQGASWMIEDVAASLA